MNFRIWASDFNNYCFCPHSVWLNQLRRNNAHIPNTTHQQFQDYLIAKNNQDRTNLERGIRAEQQYRPYRKEHKEESNFASYLAVVGFLFLLSGFVSKILLSFFIGLFLLALAIFLELRKPPEPNLPSGTVIYDGRPKETPSIFNPEINLSGKPDTIVQFPNGKVMVQELKSTFPPSGKPYRGHVLQMVAGVILAETRGYQVAYGKVTYIGAKEFTYSDLEPLKKELYFTIQKMRSYNGQGRRASENRCRTCVYNGNLCRLQ